jgi:outer membrane protein
MKRRIPVLLAFVLTGAPAAAQTTAAAGTPITLEEAERRALARNPQIAQARLGTEASDYSIAGARAAYTPTFTASIEQRSQTTAATSQLTGGEQVTTDNSIYGSGVSQLLPWGGGSLDVDFSSGRTSTSNLFSTYNPSFSGSVLASYTQPLLRGFRFDTTREQVAQSRIARSIADVRLRQQIATTLADVRRAYWELVYAADAVETARRSQALAERQVEENQLRAEIGTVARIDVLQSEAEAASRRQATVQTEGAWRAAMVTLKELIVADTADPVWLTTLTPVDHPTYGTSGVDLQDAIRTALANRTDLDEARRDRESADLSVRLFGDERKPGVDLVAGYTLNGIGGTQVLRESSALGGTIIGTVPGSYWDALESLVDYPAWSVGLNVTIPLGTSAADAGYARARVERRQTDTRIQALELQVAADLTRAADQIRTAEQQVQAAVTARQLAEKRLEAEDARLDVGLSTTFLVLQAQRDLATAETTELRALLDYRTALVDFELAQEAP